jgi:hypothetical protein
MGSYELTGEPCEPPGWAHEAAEAWAYGLGVGGWRSSEFDGTTWIRAKGFWVLAEDTPYRTSRRDREDRLMPAGTEIGTVMEQRPPEGPSCWAVYLPRQSQCRWLVNGPPLLVPPPPPREPTGPRKLQRTHRGIPPAPGGER